jgi:hypothetical protein
MDVRVDVLGVKVVAVGGVAWEVAGGGYVATRGLSGVGSAVCEG